MPELSAAVINTAEAVALVGCLAIADSQLTSARASAADAQRRRGEHTVRAQKALQAAQRAAAKGSKWHGFGSSMKSVAKWAGVAALASSAVATGGASLAATPTLLVIAGSAASFAMKQTGADTKICRLGGVDLRASDLVLLGSLAAGMGLGMAPSDDARGLAAGVARGARGVSGAATAGAAVATVREGRYRAETLRRQSDALAEELAAEHETRALGDAIDALRASGQFRARALEAVSQLLKTKEAATAALVGRRA